MKNLTTKLVLISFLLVFAGCATSGIERTTTTKANGEVIVEEKVGADIAAMQLQVKQDEARAKVIEAASKLDSHAQVAMTAKGEVFDQAIDAYIRGENTEVNAVANVLTKGIWGLLGFGVAREQGKTNREGYRQAGNSESNVLTNSRQVNKSDRSTASGDDEIGSNIIIQQHDIDANQTIPATNPESSFDGEAGQGLNHPVDVSSEIDLI